MDSPLLRFAADHDGVVTTEVAWSHGYGPSVLRALVESGGWRRIGRAAYLAPGAPESLRARVRAVQLRRPTLTASHRTAAALLLGSATDQTPLEFTAPGPSRFDVPGGNLVRWSVDADQIADVGGLRTTSPARTAADLLRALPPHDAVMEVDALLSRRRTDLRDVAAALDRARGTRYVRRAWRSFRRLDPRAESPAESKARLVLADAGLRPRTQVVLVDRPGRQVRVDLWFPAGVAVEIEGYAHHSTTDQHRADIARFNELARLPGVAVLRFSWLDVFSRQAAMVGTVRAALARAAAVTPTGEYARAGGGHW